MNIQLYTKSNCASCVKAKALLNIRDVAYSETVIGEGILREDFMALFPEQKTVPLIIIDGVKVGGYEQLRDYLDRAAA